MEITETISASPVEETTIPLQAPALELNNKENEPTKKQIDETLKIVITDDDNDNDVERELPSISPPRKSARLTAKRRDSTADSDSRESPVPKRRSMRLNSASSQDTPPTKIRDEAKVKKMPTIAETNAQSGRDSTEKTDAKNFSEQALVDELAAAFVEEFID